jgi:hypothetical protein
MYEVLVRIDGSWSCDCPSWVYGRAKRGDCKHIRLVQDGHVSAKQFDGDISAQRMSHVEVA